MSRGRCRKLEIESVTAQGSIETYKHNDEIRQLTSLWFVWTLLACKMSKNYCLRVSSTSPVTIEMKGFLSFVRATKVRVRALFTSPFDAFHISLPLWSTEAKGIFSWFLGYVAGLHLSHMFSVVNGWIVKRPHPVHIIQLSPVMKHCVEWRAPQQLEMALWESHMESLYTSIFLVHWSGLCMKTIHCYSETICLITCPSSPKRTCPVLEVGSKSLCLCLVLSMRQWH